MKDNSIKNNYEDNRLEFSRRGFREGLIEKLGCVCVNCGSTEHIEFHHIVPLRLGGTNNLSNIVPLCVDCHYKAHGKTNSEGIRKAKKNGTIGRKHKKSYDECYDFIFDYVHGKIGKREFKIKCEYAEKTKLDYCSHIERFKEENDISKFRNIIDVITTNGSLTKGKKVGFVEYKDGTHSELLYSGEDIINSRVRIDDSIRYITGFIGKEEYLKRIGYLQNKDINKCKELNKALKDNKIVKISNNIDQINAIRGVKNGCKVGHIIFEGGEVREIYYKKYKDIKSILEDA